MTIEEKRTSERIVPIGSSEDVVILHLAGEQHLAKILDLSDGGICVYLVEPDAAIGIGDECRVSLYHEGRIEDLDVRVNRRNGQVIGLAFAELGSQAREHVRAKIIRLEVQWMKMRPEV